MYGLSAPPVMNTSAVVSTMSFACIWRATECGATPRRSCTPNTTLERYVAAITDDCSQIATRAGF